MSSLFLLWRSSLRNIDIHISTVLGGMESEPHLCCFEAALAISWVLRRFTAKESYPAPPDAKNTLGRAYFGSGVAFDLVACLFDAVDKRLGVHVVTTN